MISIPSKINLSVLYHHLSCPFHGVLLGSTLRFPRVEGNIQMFLIALISSSSSQTSGDNLLLSSEPTHYHVAFMTHNTASSWSRYLP